MNNADFLSKLTARLEKLPEDDLRLLAALLRRPLIAQVLVHFLCELVPDLIDATVLARPRQPVRSLFDSSEDQQLRRGNGAKDLQIEPARQDREIPDAEVNGIVDSALSNKTLFPTTRDVLDAARSIFGLAMPARSAVKHGRQRVIRKCLALLEELPAQGRRRLGRDFLQWMSMRSGHSDSYRELFRALTRNQ